MSRVILNARFTSRPITGVERFASEVSRRLPGQQGIALEEVAPTTPVQGLKGHAWEQFTLPLQIPGDSVLFSPCNTGPLATRRQLVVMHDAAVWDRPEGFSRSFRHLYQHLLPRLARRCRALATVSQFSRQRLARHLRIPEERIAVLGNAAGPGFSPGPDAPPSHRDPVILCVCSLDPRKNLPFLLKTWARLRKSGHLPDNARLHLIGGANPRNFAAFQRVEDDQSVRWLGRVSDEELVRHYREADAFLFPSLYEGFGLPPLEAMACGCPVLLSDRASLPEVGGPACENAGAEESGAALYFDPESEDDLGRALVKFLSFDASQKARLRANAQTRAKAFSWDQIAGETAKLLCGIF